jgi:DNA polymerase-3 subunit epsilon
MSMDPATLQTLTPENLDATWRLAAFVDCETTGLDPTKHELIELALVLFAYDPATGEVKGVVDEYAGFREPRGRIHAASHRKHGITRAMVRGRQLEAERVNSILHRADVVIAHNARFDRAFVAGLFPLANERHWYCSMNDIRWAAKGFSSRSLQNLLDQHAILTDRAHRALADARAGTILLAQKTDGHTYLSELLRRGRRARRRSEAKAATAAPVVNAPVPYTPVGSGEERAEKSEAPRDKSLVVLTGLAILLGLLLFAGLRGCPKYW